MVERDGPAWLGRSFGHVGLVWRRLQLVCARGISVTEQGGDARGNGSGVASSGALVKDRRASAMRWEVSFAL